MARRPSKSKSAEERQALRSRSFAFLLDWASWGYIAYGIVYLLNQYWYTNIHYYGRLTVPLWGWPIVVLGTLELAALSHAFGNTPGLSLFGLRVISDSLTPPSIGERWRRYLAWQVAVLSFPVTLWVFARKNQLLHDRVTGTQMVVVKQHTDELSVLPPRPWYRTNRGVMSLVLIGVTLWVGWLVTAIDLHILISRASTSAYLWKELLSPHFTHLITPDPVLQQSIVGGMVETIFMALLASAGGAIVALPLSFLGARNIMGFSPIGWFVFVVVRGVFNVVRSIESLLWATVFAVWVGFGTFAGVIALGVHTVAALGKLYSEQVEGIDPGPLEAIAATGARRWQVVLYGVIPQVVPSFLAFTLYRWDINVRMATVIALVGGGGLGRIMFYYKSQVGLLPDAWNQVGAVILTIIVVVWALDYVSGRVREKIL